jgi:pyrimidine deaminase RibD-like protein/NTP pyrophosphatase (non-canonical NTP hydrolase)
MTDLELMEIAVDEARKSVPEDNQPRPKVGVVIARDGVVLARAHRNEDGNGSHAEYLALQKIKENGLTAEGATVYTTLEPCMYRKSQNKIPCAQRLIDARVARVVWGIIDPHKTVQSQGIVRLRKNQIETDSFPHDLAKQVEDLNHGFIRAFTTGEATPEFIANNHGRPLDVWYETVNRIYWSQNVRRSPAELFGHLVETIGGVSLFETGKTKPGADPRAFVVKAISWWLALCGRLRVRSVEDMVWAKFPGACPYCQQTPHRADCKSSGESPDWNALRVIGATRTKPTGLGAWQLMFSEVYPETRNSPQGRIYAHLSEELGELAEAVRVFDVAPGLFLNEAPDVFAWIMQIQNSLDQNSETTGANLERAFCTAFPDLCRYCAAETCQCPAILPSTVGRLGGAMAPTTFKDGDRNVDAFTSVDRAAQQFGF